MDKGIILSMTSYPKRIGSVSKVIERLFYQSIKASKILLWLSLCEFPEKEKNLPRELVDIEGKNGFEICWVEENLRSHKKYYHAFQKYKDYIIITVDDDICYSSTMVEELLNSYVQFPNAISARNVRIMLRHADRIADYELWDGNSEGYKKSERMDLCAIGWGGVLYPPHIYRDRWFDTEAIESLSPDQDDLWLKYNEILDGIPVVYTGQESQDVVMMEAQECALHKLNMCGKQNDICVSELQKWSRIQNNLLIEQWYKGLYDCNAFYKEKRKQMAIDFRNILADKENKKIFICGAGKFAKALIKLFDYCQIRKKITGLLVSDYNGIFMNLDEIPVFLIDDVELDENVLVLCGVGEKNRQILKPRFDTKPCSWLDMDLPSIFTCFETIKCE